MNDKQNPKTICSDEVLFTVYELYQMNNRTFPFWIKSAMNPTTCLEVLGWDYINQIKTYQGVSVAFLNFTIKEPECPTDQTEDFFEKGLFYGMRYYMDKQTRVRSVNGSEQTTLMVAGGSTRSWKQG